MTNCRTNIPNCRVCPFQSSGTCVACEAGYLLHSNTCVQKCPSGFVSYENITCIMT